MQYRLITFKASPIATAKSRIYRIDGAQGLGEKQRNKGPSSVCAVGKHNENWKSFTNQQVKASFQQT